MGMANKPTWYEVGHIVDKANEPSHRAKDFGVADCEHLLVKARIEHANVPRQRASVVDSSLR